MYLQRLVLVFCVALAGCDSDRLTYTTASGAASVVSPIYHDQALNNLANLIAEPNTIPSQVTLQTGIMQTNATLTPSVSFPLSSGIMHAVGATIYLVHRGSGRHGPG